MFFSRIFFIFAIAHALLSYTFIQSESFDSIHLHRDFSESEKLSQVFESYFDEMQKTCPEFATYVGFTNHFDALWSDHSEEGYDFRYELFKAKLRELHSIDYAELSPLEQVNYELLESDLSNHLKEYEFQTYYMPLDQLGGIPLDVESILAMMPKASEKDYESILQRLSSLPLLVNQTIDLLELGLEKGMTKPQVCLRQLPDCIAKMIPDSIEESVFFQPFLSFPESFAIEQKEVLALRAIGLIDQFIYPAYEKLKDYLEITYLPACRGTVSASSLPNGQEYYAYCIKRHTSLTWSPEEIHLIGLSEVERIRGEMQTIINKIEFWGSITDYIVYLNTEPQFFYTEPESLIEGYRAITSYIDTQLPLLFGRLPVLPYEVLPIPEFAQEGQVSAYYMRGSLSTGRPGRFFANTFDMGSRPKWQMESLALHEAVPGHHFQISIAQEIQGLPEFRKYNGCTAYIEGWGLYSESLGTELGLYKTPENQFGRLIEEIWRAVRLVVDTGIHALGWSREEAIDYMMANTGMGKREVTTEIDRYIVWPGQALAYKIGEISIKSWRQKAEETLGDGFDLRAFHDMLLGQGALPLDLCDKQVNDWIEAQLANASR